MKKFLKAYFDYTRAEMNGIMLLSVIILLLYLVPLLRIHKEEKFDFRDFKKEIETIRLAAPEHFSRSGTLPQKPASGPVRYFNFDPNVIGTKEWLQLGVSGHTAAIIRNFLNKKGHFYRKEDLKKIYSLDPADYDRLEKYIVIADRAAEAPARSAPERIQRAAIDLNAADSAALESLSGIGPAFARRIIAYRDRLGGFYKTEQLKEVYGIDSLEYEQIRTQVIVGQPVLKMININTAVFDDLKRFPYLTYKQINSLVQYRKQHGAYRSPENLLETGTISAEDLEKITPYLSF